MSGTTDCISILMVGRIYEEEEVFKLIEKAVSTIGELMAAHFYFTDGKTMNKMQASKPAYISLEFKPDVHNSIIDYVVTIGGDGTILYAVKEFKERVPPLITFQRGSLGFMCRFSLDQIEETLRKLVHYHQETIELPFEEANIMRLEVIKTNFKYQNVPNVIKVCVNEVYISRKGHERIALEIEVNGEFFTQTAGDGILISTPTGSTAYSLSAGGPILQNGVNGILIVPIAPNSLSFRPICLPSDCTIRVKLSKLTRSEAMISFDGQTIEQFGLANQIIIKKSKYDLTFFQPKKDMQQMPTWIQRLKYFLGWNEKYKTPLSDFIPEILEHTFECIQ